VIGLVVEGEVVRSGVECEAEELELGLLLPTTDRHRHLGN
jgi:hypothetical protein